MKKSKMKVNIILSIIILIIIIVLLFVDSSSLNSLYVVSDEFIISYVNTASEEEEVVEKEVIKEDKAEESKVVAVSNVTNVTTNNWVWPTAANYVITSYYGYRWGSMHDAIDISGPGYGSNVYAANSGVATTVKGGCVAGYTSCNGRGGNYVVIKHNIGNYYTIYMHLKDIYVSSGQSVTGGQVIGSMGNTGNVVPVPTSSNPYAGTHLHFGLYVGEPYNGGYSVNPMNLY